jgi:hypothetical protein
MPMPIIVGVGAGTGSAGAVTPAYPAGYTAVALDVAFTFIESDFTDTITPPTNWAELSNSPVSNGTTTKLTVLWRRLTAGEAAPTIGDAGNHMQARMIVLGGCVTTGNPWHLVLPSAETITDTTVSIPGVTTTVPNCLILTAFTTGQDTSSTAGATGWTNGNLVNLTERMDNWTATGTGGGLAMASGEKAVAGATGATTATLSLTANFKAQMTIAIAGAAASGDGFPAWKRKPSGLYMRG